MRTHSKLSAKTVEKLLREGKPDSHFDGEGLYLIIKSQTASRWERRYQFRGVERYMGLGSAAVVSLADVRDRNRKISQLLTGGIDPLAQKHAERAARSAAVTRTIVFAKAVEQYREQHEPKWSNAKHIYQFNATLRDYVLPIIGDMEVSAIGTPEILSVLEQTVQRPPVGPFWYTRPETADRTRSRIEAILSWATVRGYRSGDNPARWRGHLAEVLPAPGQVAKVEHHPALPYRQVSQFMADLRMREGTAARALEFTIMTAARTGEVVGAQLQEIDLAGGVWTIPAGRMKSGREHRVPLAMPASDLLRDLPRERGNSFLFLGPRGAGLSNMAMTSVLRRMGSGEITVHGFRSSFRDWAAETTSFPNHVIEMALAHKISDAVEAAYRRGDLFEKRKQLMDAWARFCLQPAADGDVVSIRHRGRAR